MADEISVNASLAYSDSEGTDVSMELVNFLATVTTKRIQRHKQAIGTSEEAIKLGEIATCGYALSINRDATNYIELKVATGGAIFAQLFAGVCAMLRLGSGAQAPYAIAHTAACQRDCFIIEV